MRRPPAAPSRTRARTRRPTDGDRRRSGPAPGPGCAAAPQGATPYLLLVPGHALAAHLLHPADDPDVPYSISTGSITDGFKLTFTGDRLRAGDLRSSAASSSTRSSTAGRPRCSTLAHRLPGRLHDRLPGRPLQEPPAVPRHRPVLHELPHPDDQLEDPARRRGTAPRPAQGHRSTSCRPTSRSSTRPISQLAGLTYNFLPFMILPLYVALEKIDPRLIEAANDLYASTGTRSARSPCRSPCRASSPARS